MSAKTTKPARSATPAPSASQTLAELANKPLAREFILNAQKCADFALRNGPDGSGWTHNESLRQDIEDYAAFARALAELLI